MTDHKMRDPETGLVVHVQSRRHTTHTVTATFAARDYGVDLMLLDLRRAVEAAADLPDDATVAVYADGAWRGLDRLCIEYVADEPLAEADQAAANPPADDHPTDVYDPAEGWDRAYEREVDRANGVV